MIRMVKSLVRLESKLKMGFDRVRSHFRMISTQYLKPCLLWISSSWHDVWVWTWWLFLTNTVWGFLYLQILVGVNTTFISYWGKRPRQSTTFDTPCLATQAIMDEPMQRWWVIGCQSPQHLYPEAAPFLPPQSSRSVHMALVRKHIKRCNCPF